MGKSMTVNVFTDGVFDLLHANHVALLREARALGDRLVVGVISDEIARGYKRQPIIPQAERLEIVASISHVSAAFIIDQPMVAATLDKIIISHDISLVAYAGHNTPEFYENAERSGIMRRPPYHNGVSTSEIIRRIGNVLRQEGQS